MAVGCLVQFFVVRCQHERRTRTRIGGSQPGPDARGRVRTHGQTGRRTGNSAHPTGSCPQGLAEVARTGARWLKALPANTLVVEHGTFNNLEQIQKFQAKHKALGTARIIAMRKTPHADDWQFALVSGPFRSEDRAKTYVSRLDWRASTRIRDTDKLKPLAVSAP